MIRNVRCLRLDKGGKIQKKLLYSVGRGVYQDNLVSSPESII